MAANLQITFFTTVVFLEVQQLCLKMIFPLVVSSLNDVLFARML